MEKIRSYTIECDPGNPVAIICRLGEYNRQFERIISPSDNLYVILRGLEKDRVPWLPGWNYID